MLDSLLVLIKKKSSLSTVCEKVKRAFRSMDCEQAFFSKEAYGQLVLHRDQCVQFRRCYEISGAKTLLINSWRYVFCHLISLILIRVRNFPWYKMRFGSAFDPLRVGLQPNFETQKRYVHMEDANAIGDVRVVLCVTPQEFNNFKTRMVSVCGEYPLVYIEDCPDERFEINET